MAHIIRPSQTDQGIPRILHQVWLGNSNLPLQFCQWQKRWQELHPRWLYHLWTDNHLAKFLPEPLLSLCVNMKNKGEASDILRYAVLFQMGGVYVDMDMEPLRSIEPLLTSNKPFVGLESNKQFSIGNAILAAGPKDRFFAQLLKEIPNYRDRARVFERTGPQFVTENYKKSDYKPRVLPYPYFYQRYPRLDVDNIYALHYCSGTWRNQERGYGTPRKEFVPTTSATNSHINRQVQLTKNEVHKPDSIPRTAVMFSVSKNKASAKPH